jgi:hypothetical protein
MKNRNSWVANILYAVIGIGILIGIITALSFILIPVIVLGLIFLLYKFPPNRWKMRSRPTFKPGRLSREREKAERKARQQKASKFRVIDGRKNRDSSDDEPPKYH